MNLNVARLSAVFVLMCIILGSCSVLKPSVPANQNSACSILDEHRSWKRHLKRSKRKWGIPVEVQMAVIWKESSFRSRVKPPRNKIMLKQLMVLGIFTNEKLAKDLQGEQASNTVLILLVGI